MKRLIWIAAAAMTLLLGGCATTVRSDVKTFHQWPQAPADKTYVFEAPPVQDDTLELRSYQELVRAELARLGFKDAGAGGAPNLTVAMKFTTTEVPVRVVQAVYPYPYSYAYMPGFYTHYYRRGYWGRSWYSGWYSPFYDPFWGPGPVFQETIEHRYKRELQVSIKAAGDGKRLYDVTVDNLSRELSTPAIMPALVQSAFDGFPGVSGSVRRVTLKREK